MKCKIIKIVTTVVALQLSLLLPVGQAFGQTSGRSDSDDDVEALRLSSYAVDYQIFWGQNGYFAAPSRANVDYNFSGTDSWLGFGDNVSWNDINSFGNGVSWNGVSFGGDGAAWNGMEDETPVGGGLLVLTAAGVCYAAARVKRLKSKD